MAEGSTRKGAGSWNESAWILGHCEGGDVGDRVALHGNTHRVEEHEAPHAR